MAVAGASIFNDGKTHPYMKTRCMHQTESVKKPTYPRSRLPKRYTPVVLCMSEDMQLVGYG